MTEGNATRGRPRGRPQGTGLDDAATLAAVADRIVGSAPGSRAVSPTGAMKQCVKGIGASHLRRLQVKWKADGDRLKEEARERVRAREEARAEAARQALAAAAASAAPPRDYLQTMMDVIGMGHPSLSADYALAGGVSGWRNGAAYEAALGAGAFAGQLAEMAKRETALARMAPDLSKILGPTALRPELLAAMGAKLPTSSATDAFLRAVEPAALKNLRQIQETLERIGLAGRWRR